MQTNEIVKLTRKQVTDLICRRREADAPGTDFEGKENRQAIRWPFPGTVEMRAAGQDAGPWFGTCRDLAEGGIGLKADQSFEPGTLLDISVHVREESFFGQATVRYCQETETDYMIGLEFVFED